MVTRHASLRLKLSRRRHLPIEDRATYFPWEDPDQNVPIVRTIGMPVFVGGTGGV